MTSEQGAVSDGDPQAGPRRRDAAGTRGLLLMAARGRFARNGYAATTVRDIADEAGVNVALISRYFASKEGLFEACLTGAASELSESVTTDLTLEQMPHMMARQLAGHEAGKIPDKLLLLLRSSGDERADQIRVEVLRSFAERLATVAGWRAGEPGSDELMLRAQVVLSVAFGVTLMRSFSALEPLSSATEVELVGPLQGLVQGLLRE